MPDQHNTTICEASDGSGVELPFLDADDPAQSMCEVCRGHGTISKMTLLPIQEQRIRDMVAGKIPEPPWKGDIIALLAEVDRLRAEVAYYRQREADICAAAGGVSDGGRYRNDIIEKLKKVMGDTARP